MHRQGLTALLWAVLLTGACAPEQAEPDIPLQRTLVLGDTFGAANDTGLFNDVRGIGFDSADGVWIAEYDAIIHKFGRDGKLVRSWERRGSGPAEFRAIGNFDMHPESGRMIVRSTTSIVVFTADFTELHRWQLPPGPYLPGVRFSFDGASVLYPHALVKDSLVDGDTWLSWVDGVVIRASLEGKVVDTLGAIRGSWNLRYVDEGGGATQTAPSSGRAVWLPVDSSTYLFANGHEEYRLYMITGRADTASVFGRRLPRRVHSRRGAIDLYQGYFTSAVLDQVRGELLVCRTQEAGRSTRRVDYFDVATTQYIGTLEWPRCPWHVSRDGRLFVLMVDEDQVQTVAAFTYGQLLR